MRVSLEHLYHYCCDICEKWWTVADIKPELSQVVYCPHCGIVNVVKGIDSYLAKTETEISPDKVFHSERSPH